MKCKTKLEMMLNGYHIYVIILQLEFFITYLFELISGRGDIYWSSKRSEGGNWGKFDEVLCFPRV